MRLGIVFILLVPVILLSVWAAYRLIAARNTTRDDSDREDRTEPRPLTGPEQHKHHKPTPSGWSGI